MLKLLAWGKSDTGRKRDHNEDRYLVDERVGLYAVADGMGGHQGGETASRMALDVLRAEVETAAVDLPAAARRLEEARRDEILRTTAPMARFSAQDTDHGVDESDEDGSGDDEDDSDEDDDDADDEWDGLGSGQRDPGGSPRGGTPGRTSDFDSEASTGATDVPRESPLLPAVTVMRAAVREAGHAIFDRALEEPALRGMGTTLTAMLYHGGRMHVVHAGDSRGYLFRDGRLHQLTDDHSWIAEQVRLGAMTEAEAKESKFRHIITRSVGFERDVDVDVKGVAVEAGDCFLLCSDGMSNYVDNTELERVLAATFYRRAPDALIDIANQRGGDDNITVVVVYVANEAA